MSQVKCDFCNSDLNISLNKEDNNLYSFSLKEQNTKENALRELLIRYLFWYNDGCPKYHRQKAQAQSDEKVQYYYDPYENKIEFLFSNTPTRTYYFKIKVFDSPEGDIWWEGRFAVHHSMKEFLKIEVLEEQKTSF